MPLSSLDGLLAPGRVGQRESAAQPETALVAMDQVIQAKALQQHGFEASSQGFRGLTEQTGRVRCLESEIEREEACDPPVRAGAKTAPVGA